MTLSIEIRIPSKDTPRAATLVAVASVSMIAGLLIAWWGMERDPHRGGAQEGGRTASAEVMGADGSEDRASANAEADARGSAGAASGEGTSADGARSSSAGARGTSAGAARGEVAAGDGSEGRASVNAEAGARGTNANAARGDDASADGARISSAGASSRPSSARRALRVQRGRVAYLRCDGLPRCPRDEPLENAVWAVIDSLPACPDGPTAPGAADIRLELLGEAAPDVAWRDTFPSTTVRLERDRVMGCVHDALTRTRQTLGSSRLVVSFRFELVAAP